MANGGSGGSGGDVWIVAHRDTGSLALGKRHWRAEDGNGGGSDRMSGRAGGALVLKVPLGTQVSTITRLPDYFGGASESVEHVADLDAHLAAHLVARGGKPGVGNAAEAGARGRRSLRHHKSPGQSGSVSYLELTLKSIADVGLVGFPNAGKSSLLRALSNAQPKVASYPFTTLTPQVGTVQYSDGRGLSVADIPGLVSGASEDRGMGHEFLRHVERTSVLLFVLDAAAGGLGGLSAAMQYRLLREELLRYSEHLCEKRSLIVANKMDLEEGARGLEELLADADVERGDVFAMSALEGGGVGELAVAMREALEAEEQRAGAEGAGEEGADGGGDWDGDGIETFYVRGDQVFESFQVAEERGRPSEP